MEVIKCIYSRRSVRQFTGEPVEPAQLNEIMRAGLWAPSGRNNQPWRFVPVTSTEVRERLAVLTKYRKIVQDARALIVVFIDTRAVYHEAKDYMAVGACIQNMLLAAHAQGLGAVWLGEILKNAAEVANVLGVPETVELMAVLALGHPEQAERESTRKGLEELVLKEFH